MSRPQVRLDADVAAALQVEAERRDSSLSTAANNVLRRTLVTGATGPPAEPASRKASLVPAQAVVTGRCPHPSNRRIGLHCAACGVTLVKPKPVRLGR